MKSNLKYFMLLLLISIRYVFEHSNNRQPYQKNKNNNFERGTAYLIKITKFRKKIQINYFIGLIYQIMVLHSRILIRFLRILIKKCFN